MNEKTYTVSVLYHFIDASPCGGWMTIPKLRGVNIDVATGAMHMANSGFNRLYSYRVMDDESGDVIFYIDAAIKRESQSSATSPT